MNEKNKVIPQYPEPLFFLDFNNNKPPKPPARGSTYSSFGRVFYVKEDSLDLNKENENKQKKIEKIQKEKNLLISYFMCMIDGSDYEKKQTSLLADFEKSADLFLTSIEELRREQATVQYLTFIDEEEKKLLTLNKILDSTLMELKERFKEET